MTVIEFLDRPTQFIVISIGNQSTNTAPELQLPTEPLLVTEDGQDFNFQLLFSDSEEDGVEFYLASIPRIGNASLSLSGLLTYTPCPNCIGIDTFEIYIVEVLADGVNTVPLTATGLLQVEVRNTNDFPQIFFYNSNSTSNYDIVQDGTINAYVEANRTSPALIAHIAGFDFDAYNDDLTIFIEAGDNGDAGYQISLDAVNTPESLPVNWSPDTPVADYADYITFVAAEINYLPNNMAFVGTDDIRIVLRDTNGAFSGFLTVHVEVLPSLCQNGGVCGGSATDPDCTDINARRTDFNQYNCSCVSGYGGQYCEAELLIPEPGPQRGMFDLIKLPSVIPCDIYRAHSFTTCGHFAACTYPFIYPTTECPNGVPIVECDGDPCVGAVCPSTMEAECRPNYCGGCTAEWFIGDSPVLCSGEVFLEYRIARKVDEMAKIAFV